MPDNNPGHNSSFRSSRFPHPRSIASGKGGLDANVHAALRQVGIAKCRADTSVAIACFARTVSAEVFEHTLVSLAGLKPLWDELLKRRRTRVMETLGDEFLWFVRHTRCQGAPAEEAAMHISPLAVLDLGYELVKRLEH